jgi:hypothetical protein
MGWASGSLICVIWRRVHRGLQPLISSPNTTSRSLFHLPLYAKASEKERKKEQTVKNAVHYIFYYAKNASKMLWRI